MNTRCLTMVALFAAIFASGCSKGSQPASIGGDAPGDSNSSSGPVAATNSAPQPVSGSDADAIRAAIEDHLRNDRGINMSAMEMSVDSVNINGDQAQANAAFHLKQGGTGMVMTYFLQRHANGWLVMRSQPNGGQFVHPPMDKAHSGMAANPANPATPGMPDMTDYLKNHPSPNSN
jgi:hypothetical protein